MSDQFKPTGVPVPEQETVQTARFQPAGAVLEFKKEEIEQPIPDQFEKIARLFPHRLAVKAGSRSVTYDELNQAANRIARAILTSQGQGSEPIALLFENGIDIIAAIFAVLKAGKFFVVLDPSLPSSRLSYLLNDSQARLVITNTRNLNLAIIRSSHSGPVLNIDEIPESFPADNIDLRLSPESLVTIVYTSGSTGEPRGVAQNHLVNMHHALLDDTLFDDRLSLCHSLSFGSGRADLFLSLLNGAALLPFDLKSEGIHRFTEWLNEERITVCHLAPAVFRQVADLLSRQDRLQYLRMIRLSGAPVTKVEFDLFKKNFPAKTLLQFNMGTTEAKRIARAVVDHTFVFPTEGVPVGYIAPGKSVLLLNPDGLQVKPGEVGEIAVKSRYLSVGYWRQPELTKERFLADSAGGEEKIYLTGDLGRMQPDGMLIHVGRKDLVVNIRGYRVELPEIEKALLSYPGVKDAGVAAWDRHRGENYLVAYIVRSNSLTVTVESLRQFVKEQLPDYMIPAAFMFLDSLPLTNGKLDRKALPRTNGQRPKLEQIYVAARNEVEQKLVDIWETALAIHPIGIHDDFFDLGGHSLVATRIISQIHEVLRTDVSMRSLLDAPTVAGLAEVIEALRWTATNADALSSGAESDDETGEL